MKTQRIHTVGEGVLTWDRDERISGRYGFVYLGEPGTNSLGGGGRILPLDYPPCSHGTLVAIVLEARDSTHCGDVFRRITPSRPEVGERIILGRGRIVRGENCQGSPQIGVDPEDGRENERSSIFSLGQVAPFPNDPPGLAYVQFGRGPSEKETAWLDVRALYRAHEQTVRLVVEED